MKIVWITIMPIKMIANSTSDLKASGGWIGSMISQLEQFEEISDIKIISICRDITCHFKVGKIEFKQIHSKTTISKYDGTILNKLKKEIQVFKPDLIDLQGVEFYLGNLLLNMSLNIPVVATLQGLTSEIWKKFSAEIPFNTLLKNRTLKDYIFRDGLYERQIQYRKRGENEIYLLKSFNYFIGRTQWDKLHSLNHNPNANYFHCDRNLRNAFYNYKWDIDKIDRYTIFTTQAHYPIKGLHILLEAISYLKRDFPLLKLVVGGKDIANPGFKGRLARGGYDDFILGLINKFEIKDSVEFTGWLNADDVAKKLTKTHVFVIPSTIENSPNSLAEAQSVGIPCVASNVGGISSYVKEGYDGLLYNDNDSAKLASLIKKVFLSDELAQDLSRNSISTTLLRHDRFNNAKKMLEIYGSILGPVESVLKK